jgi:hypothetical protein
MLAYVRIIEGIETDSVDLVLIDGVYRDHCTLEALRVIRPGGILVIDDINRYFPCDSLSPDSRTLQQGPKGETWGAVHKRISQWRKIWTTSGISDTAFFLKPCGK